MLTIIEGSRDALVAEMKRFKEGNRLAINETKALIKRTRALLKTALSEENFELIAEHSNTINSAQYTLHLLEDRVKYDLSVTKVLPVELEGFIYNLIMLEDIERKLKGHSITLDVDHVGTMFITYTNNRGAKGFIELKPLTAWYATVLDELPKAESKHAIPGNNAYYKGRGWAL